jgi:hypothetical protein
MFNRVHIIRKPFNALDRCVSGVGTSPQQQPTKKWVHMQQMVQLTLALTRLIMWAWQQLLFNLEDLFCPSARPTSQFQFKRI